MATIYNVQRLLAWHINPKYYTIYCTFLIAKININEINFTLLRATGQLQRALYVFCIVPNYKYLPSEIGMKISNRLK